MEDQSEKHFGMLRAFALADVITLGNASFGMAAIFLCLNHVADQKTPYLWCVFILLPLAVVCDLLDGFVARRLSRRSALGADLDSLADIVSFGVAPAVLGFALGLRGLWDAIILIWFVACGVSRLARFNVTAMDLADERGKVRYYQGTPITTSIILAGLLGMFYWLGWVDSHIPFGSFHIGPWEFHPLAVLYAVNGGTMISSTLRIPKP
jgi:CDP-diacylglycerol--serine O-phosphatidyltransferase